MMPWIYSFAIAAKSFFSSGKTAAFRLLFVFVVVAINDNSFGYIIGVENAC